MWALWTALAFGQAEPVGVPEMNVQLFRPSLDAVNTLWVDDVRGGTDGLTPRVLMHYTGRPLSFQYGGGNAVPVVDGVAMADVLLGYGSGPVRFGVDVPVVLSAEGIAASGEFGIGDVAGDLRITAVRDDDDAGGLGFNVRYALPTATTANPLGSPNGDWEASVIADARLFRPFRLLANAGFGGHPGVEVDGVANTQLRLRGGLVAELSETRGLALEWIARESLRPEGGTRRAGDAAELMLSGYAQAPGVTLRGGIGTSGSAPGIGAPDLRAVLGIDWSRTPPPPDTDGDGLLDPDDLCRTRPEDFDGILDDDGCPDPTPKVMIDLVDAYGEVVTGEISVYDGSTRVGRREGGQEWMLEPGTYRVVASEDGKDVERQLVVDPADTMRLFEVPMALLGKIKVTVVDTAGNPITGARFFEKREKIGEGAEWAESMEAGKHRLMVRAKGFRPTRVMVNVVEGGVTTKLIRLKPSQVALDGDRFALGDSVYFDEGAAVLSPRSYQLLDEIADVMKDNPGVLQVRIEGHTDAQGRASDNKALSQSRADAVRDYLVSSGVETERLEPVGYGEEQLVDTGTTEEAHEKNRRVEFVVTKQAR